MGKWIKKILPVIFLGLIIGFALPVEVEAAKKSVKYAKPNGKKSSKTMGKKAKVTAKKSSKKVKGADARVLAAVREFNGLPFGSAIFAVIFLSFLIRTLPSLSRISFVQRWPIRRSGTTLFVIFLPSIRIVSAL